MATPMLSVEGAVAEFELTRQHWLRREEHYLVQPHRGRIGTQAARNSRVRVASCTPNAAAILASDNPLA